MKDSYNYPDSGDGITLGKIQAAEAGTSGWHKSEEVALNALELQLIRLLPHRGSVRALDAGCGEGRLLCWLELFAQNILAIDPDHSRLEIAKNNSVNNASIVDYRCMYPQYISNKEFELILCSHVIQHINTKDVVSLFRILFNLASKKGLLVLAYSCAQVENERFGIASTSEGGHKIEYISKNQFDKLTNNPSLHIGVPFKRFDPISLQKELANCGWSVIWRWHYHVTDSYGKLLTSEQECAINEAGSLHISAESDCMFLLQKT